MIRNFRRKSHGFFLGDDTREVFWLGAGFDELNNGAVP